MNYVQENVLPRLSCFTSHHAGANRFARETGSDKEYAALILRFIGLQYIGIELLFCLSVFN